MMSNKNEFTCLDRAIIHGLKQFITYQPSPSTYHIKSLTKYPLLRNQITEDTITFLTI